jgi:Zn finger protein HypA/HybF involved in hydrogenase expression
LLTVGEITPPHSLDREQLEGAFEVVGKRSAQCDALIRTRLIKSEFDCVEPGSLEFKARR